jgi:hypothetical protein
MVVEPTTIGSVADNSTIAGRHHAMAVDRSRVEYDQKGQLEAVEPWILEGERLYAVYDLKGSGTGFVAITNKRLLFYDKALMRKKKALTSIPFSKITAVISVDEGGIFRSTSELAVQVGSHEYELEFRGGDKAQRAYHRSCLNYSRVKSPKGTLRWRKRTQPDLRMYEVSKGVSHALLIAQSDVDL